MQASSWRYNALYVFPVTCLGLAYWQYSRLQWKQSLIATLNEGLSAPPVELSSDISRLSEQEYNRVFVRGKFMHQLEMLVGPRNMGGPGRIGYYLYTPLLLPSGSVIIVNRGWIPQSHVSYQSRFSMHRLACPQGEVEVHGLLKRPELYRPQSLVRQLGSGKSSTQFEKKSNSPLWMWVEIDDMRDYIKGHFDYLRSAVSGESLKADPAIKEFTKHEEHPIITEFFLQETIPPTSLELEEDLRQITEEMKKWQQDLEEREDANSSMPTILASAKGSKMETRLFYGKPIVGFASLNVKNKHEGYIYTWLSLAGLLFVSLFLGRRRKNPAVHSWIKKK